MARIPSDLRKILLEVFDWKSMVMDGNEPSQDYVAVSEAVREAAHDYNNRWSIFEGYNGGDGVTAVDIQKPPPPRRRRRKKHA